MILGPAGPGSAAATCRGYRPFLYKQDERLRVNGFMVMIEKVSCSPCVWRFLFCSDLRYH